MTRTFETGTRRSGSSPNSERLVGGRNHEEDVDSNLSIAIALTITASAFAQSPTATRQRRTSSEDTQPRDRRPRSLQPTPAEVTADAQTNRMDATSDEEAIVQQYNNFFTTYRLGPEDVISVNVFAQERYSKQGISHPAQRPNLSRADSRRHLCQRQDRRSSLGTDQEALRRIHH